MDKLAMRERVWAKLRHEGAARFPGADGRIRTFAGAETAARRLAELDAWVGDSVLKCNPDAPQLPVRAAALEAGKLVYTAVPRLRDRRPFVLLDPSTLDRSPKAAASIRGAERAGRPVRVGDVRRIDLVVCGSVAVDRRGARLGKGGGFSDLEFALLTEAGLVDYHTVVATTVHPLQVLDEPLPETRHDFRVDLIVTPDEVIRVGRARLSRPPGIIWEDLDEAKIAQVPLLADLARRRERGGRKRAGKA